MIFYIYIPAVLRPSADLLQDVGLEFLFPIGCTVFPSPGLLVPVLHRVPDPVERPTSESPAGRIARDAIAKKGDQFGSAS